MSPAEAVPLRSSCASDSRSFPYADEEAEGERKIARLDQQRPNFLSASSRRPGVTSNFWSLRSLERIVLVVLLVLIAASATHRWSSPSSGPKGTILTTTLDDGLPSGRIPPIDPTAVRAKVPPNTKIVGLVFFGRPVFVDILDCYMRRNLVTNGGILDEIRFIAHTSEKQDIDWLENLIVRDSLQSQYIVLHETKDLSAGVWAEGGQFSYLWGKYATDNDTIYIKIDDDLVYIEDSAIPRMVNSLLDHPEAYSIQANIINSQFTYWYHLTAGAIFPFLPDPLKRGRKAFPDLTSWRISDLPQYPMSKLPRGNRPVLEWTVAADSVSPVWLPLPKTASNLLRTPFHDGTSLPDPRTGRIPRGLRWPLAMQEHLSFFDNLEAGTLSTYSFGRPTDGLWNANFKHYNINFMAFWGKNIAKRPFWTPGTPEFLPNDEYALTIDLPRELGMPVLVDTRALVSHYAFHWNQRDGLMRTDLLERYRLLANEQACSASNQKVKFTTMEEFMLAQASIHAAEEDADEAVE